MAACHRQQWENRTLSSDLRKYHYGSQLAALPTDLPVKRKAVLFAVSERLLGSLASVKPVVYLAKLLSKEGICYLPFPNYEALHPVLFIVLSLKMHPETTH